MKRFCGMLACALMAAALCGGVFAQDEGKVEFKDAEKYLGNWGLDLPGGAGWLQIRKDTDMNGNPYLDGDILWYGGSVVPISNMYLWSKEGVGEVLVVTRVSDVPRKKEGDRVVRSHVLTEAIQFAFPKDSKDNDMMLGYRGVPARNGLGIETMLPFKAFRIPPPPPAPDLSKVEYDEPISLFNGENLDGWKLTDPNAVSGWSIRNGILTNDPKQEPGKPHINYGNLRTEREFKDFNLTLEVRVPPDGNSGVYLRGIYEVQVADTYGKPLDSHNMGAIYSRITPKVNAEKPAGEWQTLDITLVDRHATVILNGTTIIDNAGLEGCTGGALWCDVNRPGPIYLQGDHMGVEYRNIVLRPVKK
ncbi:MAG: DUF1080 domain-containing protein [bacterium]|nr:DUF1080 domain-containing protein [bacterium]